MRYSIKFYKGCRVLSAADEVILKYNLEPEICNYIKENHPNQRIVLNIKDVDVTAENRHTILDSLKKVCNSHKNSTVLLSWENQVDLAPDLYELNIPFFFDLRVTTLDTLSKITQLGVSDVYICNNLCFSLSTIAPICHKYGINIRVYPNVLQYEKEKTTPYLCNFFLRPEDIKYYEKYIDYLEFFGDRLDKQSVLFEIYKSGRWEGKLNDLILGFEDEVFNEEVIVDFGKYRTSCRHSCDSDKCNLCGAVNDLLKTYNRIREESDKTLKFISVE